MFLFLSVICQSHTNLLHGLTHFWRVISERIHKKKDESTFQDTETSQWNIVQIILHTCKIKWTCSLLLYKWSVPLFHCFPFPDLLEEASRGQEDLLLPATRFPENLPRSTYTKYSGGQPGKGEMRQPLVQDGAFRNYSLTAEDPEKMETESLAEQ